MFHRLLFIDFYILYSVAYSYFKVGIDIQDKKNYQQGDTVTCTKTFYPFTAKKKKKKEKKLIIYKSKA